MRSEANETSVVNGCFDSRQVDVLRLVARGFTNREIGKTLFISSVGIKLDLNSRKFCSETKFYLMKPLIKSVQTITGG